jgi:hypothetical protein
MFPFFFFSFFYTGIVRYRQNEHNRFITSLTTIEIDIVAIEREREYKKTEQQQQKKKKRKRFYELHEEQPILFFCNTKQDNTQTATSIKQ